MQDDTLTIEQDDFVQPDGAASTTTGPGQPPPPPASRDGDHGSGGLGWRQYLAVAVVAALAAAAVAVPLTILEDDPAAAPAASQASQTGGEGSDPGSEVTIEPGDSLVSAIAKQVGPSVVRIDVSSGLQSGAGSGFVYSADGTIVTNAHVVGNAEQVRVQTPDGQRLDAEVLGIDPRSDVAVLRVDADDLPVPPFAESAPEVGDTAIAIGSPFGLDGSVTSGIVSALNRTVTAGQTPLVDMIQTDAAINPGNSGGVLVNGEGRIIGMNTAIASRGGGNDGIGFAIPIDTVRSVADQILETGEVQHAFLGIAGQTVDPDVAELYNLPVAEGVVIGQVTPDTPAAEAGLQRGDIIVAIDGEEVTSMAELAAEVQRRRPGDEVEVTFNRGGEQQTVTATLIERPSS